MMTIICRLVKQSPHPVTGKERGDIEIKDYVVLQKPQTQDNRLPPPHTLIMDYTMTHIRFGRSHLHPMGQLTHSFDSGHYRTYQFRFLTSSCFANLKGAVGLIMTKASVMQFLHVLPKCHKMSVYFSLSLAFVLVIVLE